MEPSEGEEIVEDVVVLLGGYSLASCSHCFFLLSTELLPGLTIDIGLVPRLFGEDDVLLVDLADIVDGDWVS